MSIQQSDKVYDILTIGLKELKSLINCANCTIFVLSQDVQRQLSQSEHASPVPNINHQPTGLAQAHQS